MREAGDAQWLVIGRAGRVKLEGPAFARLNSVVYTSFASGSVKDMQHVLFTPYQ